MDGNAALEALLEERRILIARVEQEREQLERLQSVVGQVSDRLEDDERTLAEIESALGMNPQLCLDDANVRLRGQHLERVALEVLKEERGEAAEVHYREWFELVRARGHHVAGKDPLNSFRSQINRSGSVEQVGRRSGMYRIRAAA